MLAAAPSYLGHLDWAPAFAGVGKYKGKRRYKGKRVKGSKRPYSTSFHAPQKSSIFGVSQPYVKLSI